MTASRKQRPVPLRSLPRHIGSWFARLVLVLSLVIGITLIAVFSFEQSTLRPLAEMLVEKSTGRSFSIEGGLDLRAGRVVSIHASRIRLANAAWGSSEDMLRIETAELSLDLLRLFDDVPTAERLVVSGVTLLFEQDEQERSNWALDPDDKPPAPAAEGHGGLVIPIVRSQLTDIDITVIGPALPQPLVIRLDSVEHSAEFNEFRASVAGAVDNRPLKLQARIGPLAELLDAGAVDFALNADFEAVALEANGRLDSLLKPRQASLQASLQSAEIARIFAAFGLPEFVSGATEIQLSLLPAGDQHTLGLTAAINSIKLDAQARLQALDSIDGASITLSAEGPDLAAAARLAGVDGLPAQPFRVASSLALAGQQLTIGETRFDTGDSRLTAQGVMSQFPQIEGTNLDLQLAGPNYLEFAELLGVAGAADLEPEPFELRTHLEYSARDHQQFTARLTLADLRGEFSGKLTEYPALIGSRIDYRLDGRNDALIQRLLGRATLIDGVYSLRGNLERTPTGFNIGHAALSVGANQLEVSGKIGVDPLRADTELTMRFQGPDLVKIAAVAGYTDFLPAGVADIAASARARDHKLQVENLTAQLGRNRLKASGLVNLQSVLNGSRADVALAGADIAELLPPEFLQYVDAQQSFELNGTLALDGGRLDIGVLQAKLGEVSLEASGSVSTTEPMADTSLKLDARGPDLSAIIPAQLVPYALPAASFSVSGGIALTATGLTLDGIDAVVGADKLGLSGTIPLDTPSEGLDLVIAASGPSLGASIPAELELDFPELAYAFDGRIQLAGGILSLQQLDFSTPRGRLAGELSLSLDSPRQFGQFDLKAKGDNLDEFALEIPGYIPASVPFDLDARGRWDSERIRIDKGNLKLNDSRIELQGEVDLPPNMVATRVKLSARGDKVADLGQFKDFILPTGAFHIDASLLGDAKGLEMPRLDASLGKNNVHGSMRIEFADKPNIEFDLASDYLDLTTLLPADESPAETATAAQPRAGDGRLIPQVTIPVEQLNRVNLKAQIKLAKLQLVNSRLRDIEVDLQLQDGELTVRQLQATAREGGISARFKATADGDRIVTSGTLEGRKVVFGSNSTGDEEITFPKQDIHLEFQTAGATSRELAANLNGYARLNGGAGRLKNSVALGLYGDFISELLSSVNPFVTREPYTKIVCFAAYAEIVDGLAKINPGAVMQTDKLDMFAYGQIDLKTERIGLRFDTSARSGIGVSVSDFVNPFIGVSGTLANPGLGVDPTNAMFEGGFAYATGGLSIIAKGLFNRWFGAADPCARMDKKAQEYRADKQLPKDQQKANQPRPTADR